MNYVAFFTKYIPDLPAPNEKGDVLIPCVLHKDGSPSLGINLFNGKWKCFAAVCPGHKGGGYKKFAALIAGEIPGVAVKNSPIDPSVVDGYHQILLKSPQMLDRLITKRGYNIETIKAFRLGFDSERVWIPILDAEGVVVNIRKYLPGAKSDKMISYSTSHGAARLFPVQSLLGGRVVVFEGEPDTLLAYQMGYPALTTTGGADTWREEFTRALQGKEVYFCYDTDGSGKKSAISHAMRLLRANETQEKKTKPYIIHLPLPGTKESKDFTNYIIDLGHAKADFDKLIESAELVTDKFAETEEGPKETREIHLSEIGDDALVNKRVKVKVLVAGKDLAPFQVPYRVAYSCEMGEKMCGGCGIAHADGQLEVKVPTWSPTLLQMRDIPSEKLDYIIADLAGVPGRCRKFRSDVKEYANLEAVKVIPEIDFSSERTPYVIRNLFFLGSGLETNHTYELDAVVMPDPKDQYGTALITEATASQDSIEKFEVTDEVVSLLKMFQAT